MPLVFSALTPHPPIMIKEVGKEDTKKVVKTIDAMEKLAVDFIKSEPETIIIVSPHGLAYPDSFNICSIENLYGDFGNFGASNVSFRYKNDLEFVKQLKSSADKSDLKTTLYDNGTNYYQLDHGTLVPLYFLTKKLEQSVKIVPITYSFDSKAVHYSFGQAIAEAIATIDQSQSKNFAFIASGDMSHRLFDKNVKGLEFDKEITNLLKKQDNREILDLDDDFIEQAGECAYRSILILLGVLDKQKYQTEILSYEGPFGVGYLVANFKI